MRLSDRYDVVCSGGSLSSYLSAALIARYGRRVLVVDDEPSHAPRVYRGSFLFDPDFPLFPGLLHPGGLGGLLSTLGIESELSKFVPVGVVSQVVGPAHRTVFGGGEAQLWEDLEQDFRGGEELSRFFRTLYRAPEEIPAFVAEVPTMGQSSSGELRRWRKFWGPQFEAIRAAHAVRLSRMPGGGVPAAGEELATALLGSLSYSAPLNVGGEQCLRGLPVFLRGQHHHPEGAFALKRRLREFIEARGGDVRAGARVEGLIAEGNRVGGVLLSSHEGIVRGDVIILGGRLRRLYATLPGDLQDPFVTRGLRRVSVSHWRYTLSITMNREAFPVGATDHMTCVGSYQEPLEEENFLKIVALPGRGQGDKEVTTLLVTALVPYRASSMDYRYLQRLSGKILLAMCNLMPFLEYNIVALFPDFTRGQRDLEECYPFEGPDWVPENLMTYYVQGHRAAQDFWGPSWRSTSPNLYFSGRSVWPSLGSYGEVLAARRIAGEVTVGARAAVTPRPMEASP